MAWVTAAEFQTWVRSDAALRHQPTVEALTLALNAAHQWFINRCERDFTKYLTATGATSKTIEAKYARGCELLIPDCTEVTAIVGASTESTSNYRAVARRTLGETWPYDRVIHTTGWTGHATWGYFTVTAKWGWAAPPEPVRLATMILAKDLAGQRDVQNGLAAITEVAGVRARENPVVTQVADQYRGHSSWGVA